MPSPTRTERYYLRDSRFGPLPRAGFGPSSLQISGARRLFGRSWPDTEPPVPLPGVGSSDARDARSVTAAHLGSVGLFSGCQRAIWDDHPLAAAVSCNEACSAEPRWWPAI